MEHTYAPSSALVLVYSYLDQSLKPTEIYAILREVVLISRPGTKTHRDPQQKLREAYS